uniref:Putative secreted protein n=1 Tax=Anopheles darlingi TaxID=43151 RepID=A0A2M4D1N5_ANODA
MQDTLAVTVTVLVVVLAARVRTVADHYRIRCEDQPTTAAPRRCSLTMMKPIRRHQMPSVMRIVRIDPSGIIAIVRTGADDFRT